MPIAIFIPSKTWFPQSLAERLVWYQNFRDQFVTNYAAILNLGAYTGDVDKDNTDFQSIGQTRLTVENFRTSIIDFMRALTEFAVGSPNPVFPLEAFMAPPQKQPAGIFQRLIELRELIMAQPNYTREMGSAMGIEPSTPDAPDAATVQPGVTLDPAVHGYLFSTLVSGRADATMWQVWLRKAGEEKWNLAATAEGKSVDIVYDPGQETGAVLLEVYVQLRKGNNDYGQPSDIKLVTVTP